MNPISLALGGVAVCFGIYTLVLRSKRPQAFAKLDAMKKKWGEKPGTIIHVVAYSIIPLVFGAVAILAGLKGIAIF
jgi:hypothetical protein